MHAFSFRFPVPAALAVALSLAFAAPAAWADGFYKQRNLVSDGFVPAAHTDPNLVNGWGVAFNPFGFVWVSSADGTVSTLYDGNGVVQSLVVQIPSPTMATGGNPTGIVFNGSDAFVVTRGAASGPARFLFATEQGVIAAWAPNVDFTHAIRKINRASTGANYKGLALSGDGLTQLLYATDFFHARVDVFDSNFMPVMLAPGAFKDPGIPKGYAPFGIQAINGDIYVTYARQDAAMSDEVRCAGCGFVSVFKPNGKFARRIATRGVLNAPWGLALAPSAFGTFHNALLVGNFGDGRINAFGASSGTPLGALRRYDGSAVHIDGLWGMQFGNGLQNQPVDTLFFAAGPDDEAHGLYGRLDFVFTP
ncbi:TIGR03118 family protein [Lysobacter sp. 2RAF19]